MSKRSERPVYAFIRQGNALVPEMQMDCRALEGIAPNQRVKVEIRQWRNSSRFRLYWQMLQKVVDATDCAPTSEYLHSAIKLEIGYGTPVKLANGMKVLVPSSVSFSSMDEPTFQKFFDDAARYLAETYGIDPLEFYEAQQEKAA